MARAGERLLPHGMELVPAVVAVFYPCTYEGDVGADRWPRQMPAVARHQLDHEIAGALRLVDGIDQRGVRGVEAKIDVEVTVFFCEDPVDDTCDAPASVEDDEAIGMIDAGENARRGRTCRRADAGC
jgi:hypothetical protein